MGVQFSCIGISESHNSEKHQFLFLLSAPLRGAESQEKEGFLEISYIHSARFRTGRSGRTESLGGAGRSGRSEPTTRKKV